MDSLFSCTFDQEESQENKKKAGHDLHDPSHVVSSSHFSAKAPDWFSSTDEVGLHNIVSQSSESAAEVVKAETKKLRVTVDKASVPGWRFWGVYAEAWIGGLDADRCTTKQVFAQHNPAWNDVFELLLMSPKESVLFVRVYKNYILIPGREELGIGAVKLSLLDLNRGDPKPIKVHLQNLRGDEDNINNEEYLVYLTLTAVNFGKKKKNQLKGSSSPSSKLSDDEEEDNGAEITQEEADSIVKNVQQPAHSIGTSSKLAFYEVDLSSVRSVPRTMMDVIRGTTDNDRVTRHYGNRVIFLDEQFTSRNKTEATEDDEQLMKQQLQTGDIILYSGHKPICQIIQTGTVSPWSHAAMIIRDPVASIREKINEGSKTADLYIFESIGRTGVRLISLEDWWKELEYGDVVAVRKLERISTKPLKGSLNTKLETWCNRTIHKQYEQNKFELLRSVFKTNTGEKGHNKSFFCSELVAATLQKLKIFNRSQLACNYIPKDLSAESNVILKMSLDAKWNYSEEYWLRPSKNDLMSASRA